MSDIPKIFSALSDPTRFAIVERLMNEGELPAGALQAGFEISAPAISRHLSVLNGAGVVNRRVNRQQRLYSVRPEIMQDICSWTMTHREFWESSLMRLEAALVEEMNKK